MKVPLVVPGDSSRQEYALARCPARKTARLDHEYLRRWRFDYDREKLLLLLLEVMADELVEMVLGLEEVVLKGLV
ncbi:unnamed protein product [Lampetra planeri]